MAAYHRVYDSHHLQADCQEPGSASFFSSSSSIRSRLRRAGSWDSLQVCYEVLITEHLEVDFGEDHQETNPHVVRIGWSLDSASFQLGKRYSKLVFCPYAKNLVSPTH